MGREKGKDGSVMNEIECVRCGRREPMPKEWESLKQTDIDYLCSGYLCESCWHIEGGEQYFRSGMAEMNGSGYGEAI